MKYILDDALKDVIIAVGGFIVVTIHANSPTPDSLAIILANSCIALALYLNLTEG